MCERTYKVQFFSALSPWGLPHERRGRGCAIRQLKRFLNDPKIDLSVKITARLSLFQV